MSLKSLQQKIGVTADGAWGPGTLRAAAAFYKLSPARAAHFFGQTSHETGGFKAFSENLNYGAKGLMGIFKKYFPTEALAKQYERNPEKIANRVYASRMGNGPESSGDGWKYRGRGALQLTGKSNYEAFAKYCNRPDVMTNPDIVANELAFESAMFFFERNKLWSICDQGVTDAAILSVSKKVNGGTHGLEDRKNKTKTYFAQLSAPAGATPKVVTPTASKGIVVPPPAQLVNVVKPATITSVKPDMQLTEHFNLKEFTKSETATRKRIDNTPNVAHAENLKNVCEKILEPVRKYFGKPVRINSGYRGPALNAAVGGSSKSQHCNGEAVDFEIDGLPNPDLAKWVSENCEFDQIILEFYDPKEGPNSGWVHASVTRGGNNRKQKLTAVTVNGKTVYKPGFVS
jgi:putative chitinase